MVRCSKRIVTPTCRGGGIPAITASYERLTAVSVVDVGHFPKAGVIEVYEDDETENT